jgi:hypothetical protein
VRVSHPAVPRNCSMLSVYMAVLVHPFPKIATYREYGFGPSTLIPPHVNHEGIAASVIRRILTPATPEFPQRSQLLYVDRGVKFGGRFSRALPAISIVMARSGCS